MLATLVIGLREGLEAALIVGIIAAFLRKNGKSLAPMWIGVALAVALSIAVGVTLRLVEEALPQSKQEAMESVIGAIAIFFVTGMIVWMNTHARGMKKELEAEAAVALSQGGAHSLAVMAFLAVLKEGFETSVFLLATFSAAQSAFLAASGAVIGVLIAVGIGWGIYAGGVKINLAKFFRGTGAFLILVAAGLTVTMLRTAHEAGWINAGQESTVNLSWLVRPGTVQSALITGVLGIPADPRRIEVIGWLAYLIPVALYVYWPMRLRPRGASVAGVQFGMAAALAAVAIVLATVNASPKAAPSDPVTLVATSGTSQQPVGSARLSAGSLMVSLTGESPVSIPLAADASTPENHNGVDATRWSTTRNQSPANATETLTLDQLAALNGGRIPIGINPQQHPGPFTVTRSTVSTDTVWTARGVLLDATESSTSIAKVSGSGLTTPRTISLADGGSADWAVSPDATTRAASVINDLIVSETDRTLWGVQLPIALALVALLFAGAGIQTLRHHRLPTGEPESGPRSIPTEANRQTADVHPMDVHPRSDTFAAH